MAPQKQAKRGRQAVSAKKRAGHGNNRGRARYDIEAAALSAGGDQAAARTSRPAAGTASDAEPPGRTGPLPALMLSWVRSHPLALATWLLSMIGLGLSIYLTIAHYDTSVGMACPDTGLVNCQKVTTSGQSMVFGVFPVAVLGLAFYVFMFVINSPAGWNLHQPAVRWLRLGSAVLGMGFVLYLIYAELIQIGNICLYCTGVHIVTFAVFILLVYDATSWTSAAARRR